MTRLEIEGSLVRASPVALNCFLEKGTLFSAKKLVLVQTWKRPDIKEKLLTRT